MRASLTPVCPACWAITGAAAWKSSPAAVKIENVFLGSRIFIFLQKRNRACIVTRRIPPVPVTSPKVKEFTTALMAVKCTVLKTLFAEMRRSRARDSLIVIVLLSDMFKETCPGPSIIFRPASPKLEPFGFVQAALGAQKAAVLNHSSVVGSLIEIAYTALDVQRSAQHARSEVQPGSNRKVTAPLPSPHNVAPCTLGHEPPGFAEWHIHDPVSREFVPLIEAGKPAVRRNVKRILRYH